jgi:AraC-like DNA-binding protein
MGHIPDHACAGTVIAVGLDREFELRVEGQHPQHGRCLLAPAGATRSVDAYGGRLAVCLIDPGISAQLPSATDQLVDALRGLTNPDLSAQWPHVWAMLGLPARPSMADKRVVRAARQLEHSVDQNLPAHELARAVGLSVSRLEHLFVKHLGAPMRTYRTWIRFRAVALAMAEGATLTAAAHAACFYDQAHFGRAFRQAFGIAPSLVLGPDVQIRAVNQA